MEGDTEAGEATRGCRLQPWPPEEPPPHGLSTSWTPILLPQATQAGVQGGLDLAPSSLGSKVFASLGKTGWADGWGQLQAPLPTGQGSLVMLGPGGPIRHGPPRPRVHPAIPLIPLPASSQRSGRLDAFSKFPGAAPSSSNSSPLAPSPPWEKAATVPTHALSWADRGRSSWPTGSCEVRGCQGGEPRLGGRHGKAARECYPEPLLLAAPFRSLCGERQMGLPVGTTVSCWPQALPEKSICPG